MFDPIRGLDREFVDLSLFRKFSPAPSIPVEALGLASAYVNSASEGSHAPADFIVSTLFAAVGALAGKSYVVAVNPEWHEPVAIWSANVGPPSSGKTPASRPILSTLQGIQSDRLKDCEDHLRNLDGPAELIGTTNSGRIIVNDSTIEALAKIEADSGSGLLVVRDELAGLIESLERYSRGVDRAYYLEAWQIGAFLIDRVRSGSTIIQNHLFALLGGIQPDRLKNLLIRSGDDDGFSARLLFFWPDLLPPKGVPSGSDHSSMERALKRIDSFVRSGDGSVNLLSLSRSAFSIYDDWYRTVDGPRLGAEGKIGSALGKMRGQLLRIAGHLHLLDWAFGTEQKVRGTIESETIECSICLIESYFIEQTHRVYGGVNLSDEEKIARHLILQCRERGLSRFNLREARRTWGIPGAHSRFAADMFRKSSDILVQSGWLTPVDDGRGSSDFRVHPIAIDEEIPLF